MRETQEQKRYFKTKEAAEYLGFSKSTLEKLRLTGDGPTFIKRGRAVIYDIDDMNAYMASNRIRSTSEIRNL